MAQERLIIKDITLDEAIQKTQTTNSKFNSWSTPENILGLEAPENHYFGVMAVTWHTLSELPRFLDKFIAHAYFPYNDSWEDGITVNLKEGDEYFSSLEELRAAYPKLFEVKGDLHIPWSL